ncbi:Transposase [Granulibacter bethesdensis]|uniref:Transposase n=1 Tax=Granulibacter bethesdensis (strain ATCC BAA-1260 / CGDNIH1) TaxID=391165 RepID=Q0BR74_GRABC|nr:Transposase [Granulibacter bethesdensis CGDNIH1]APG30724.1 Transposase [Granulibacter bethesdensis]APH52535.1 Transposase [Granulibacter bethesdensis]APH65224.1 Transposase [Granulibacter bethesdensis]
MPRPSRCQSPNGKLREKVGFKHAAVAVAASSRSSCTPCCAPANYSLGAPLPPDPRPRQRQWRGEASLLGRRLVHSASDVAPRTPVRCVRNEHRKDHLGSPMIRRLMSTVKTTVT